MWENYKIYSLFTERGEQQGTGFMWVCTSVRLRVCRFHIRMCMSNYREVTRKYHSLINLKFVCSQASDSSFAIDATHAQTAQMNTAQASTSQADTAQVDISPDDLPIDEPLEKEKPPLIWMLEETFEGSAELQLFLQEESCWSRSNKKTLTKGVKGIYRCNKVKRYGQQCSHAIYTLEDFEPGNAQIQLYRNNWPHDHDDHNNRVTGIPNEIKQSILTIMEENKAATPKYILHRCQEKFGAKAPTRKQIANVIQHHKNKKYGTAKVTMNDLIQFFNDNKNIRDDPDKAFVVDFQRSPPTESQKWFRLFVTTKRLLENSVDARCVHPDATHRIMI